MRKFLAASALFAMAAATVVHAEPGGNKGGNDRGPAAQAKGNGGGQANRASVARQDRGPAKAAERGRAIGQDRSRDLAERRPATRGNGGDRGPDKATRPANAGHDADRRAERDVERRIERRVEREVRNAGSDERIRDSRRNARIERAADFNFLDNRGLIEGCPPGLAKKRNGCTPPGLLNQRRDDNYSYREAYYRPDWWGYESLGGRLFYDDGYLYRMGNNNSILGYIPLLGGALSVGNVWPSTYQPMQVPNYYADYYDLGPQGSYRYADNVLYRVDPESAAITSIAALLTGDEFTVGQPMPAGYDVYNVPSAYRDRYYDRPDSLFRYSDGYVYQVDPETRLIAAAIELLI